MTKIETFHDELLKKTTPALRYDESRDYAAWRATVREKYMSLLGLDLIEQNKGDLTPVIELTEEHEGYTLTRFHFASEPGTEVPCYLLIPKTGKKTYPVAITLQGHTTGFHNSIGIIKYDYDKSYQPRGGFALQAVEHGYAALCIEQRGMGERVPAGTQSCIYTASRALHLGRTILGERVWDIHCAIDVLAASFPACDTGRVLITGNSGGGTASFYAACYDERIALCAPSCAVCSYETSILAMYHCICNYIPGAYRQFEMQDLACLIAPRRLTMINGREDEIFPIEGAREAYRTVEAIYRRAGAKDACRMVETPREHWWCHELVWATIDEETKKLGW